MEKEEATKKMISLKDTQVEETKLGIWFEKIIMEESKYIVPFWILIVWHESTFLRSIAILQYSCLVFFLKDSSSNRS